VSDYLIWGMVLFGIAGLLFVVEILIPSGGIIGLVAIAVALGGVSAFFFESPILGSASLAGLLVLIPFLINFALKIIPNTPIGKRLMLGDDDDEESQFKRETAKRVEEERKRALVGAEGVTMTPMRPSGSVKIDGVVIEASCETGMIEAGTRVRVTRLDGFVVRVRPV
jgi:membrane-bound serine protease (ClpP class)